MREESRKRCSFPSVSAGGRIERRQFSANRRTPARLVKVSRFSGWPKHRTRPRRDGSLCRCRRHCNLAGQRDRKNKFVHWLRSNGFMAVTKDGAPAEEGHYKANVDVMMAIDALELSIEMRTRCRDSREWRRRFRLSRYQAPPARNPRGSRVSCRKSREHIEISCERRDRSGAALSDVRHHQPARHGTRVGRRPRNQVAGGSAG